MILISDQERRRAFSIWLRSGRLPSVRNAAGVELKFNPWHDPENGQFTFAGSRRYFGKGGAGPAKRASDRVPGTVDRDRLLEAQIATRPNVEAPRAKRPARDRRTPEGRGASETPSKPIATAGPGDQPNPATEFVGGVGEGLYRVAQETVAATYSALTTNPLKTARSAGLGIAGAIDKAMAAENTPARVHITRAAGAVADASAREIGRATGSVVGNAGLALMPGAAAAKVSALRRLRKVTPRVTYDPPQIGWVKETINSDKAWRVYNDTATGARPRQAPALTRTMPNGSKRPVKFDGVQGDTLIDRKWSVWNTPRAQAQALRQSEALAQHRLIGTWEVPNEGERAAAIKLLKKLKVSNIKVRIVKP